MGSKANAKSSSENAKRMKEAGIRRQTTPCPVCYGTVRLPYNGHNCRDNRRNTTPHKTPAHTPRKPSLSAIVAKAQSHGGSRYGHAVDILETTGIPADTYFGTDILNRYAAA